MPDMDKITSWAEVLLWVCVGFFLLWFLARWILLEIRSHKNSSTPVVTCGATVLLLHPETTYLPQGRATSTVFHVTFLTDSGWDVTVYMNYDQYYILKEGDRGQLTYQGERFWRFIPET